MTEPVSLREYIDLKFDHVEELAAKQERLNDERWSALGHKLNTAAKAQTTAIGKAQEAADYGCGLASY